MSEMDKVFYVGTFRHALDAKNRLTIPAKWRFAGDEGEASYLAMPNSNQSITVYPPRMIVDLEAKLRGVSMLSDPQQVNSLIKLFAKGDRFGCDTQGRIGLSEDLRRHAGLTKDVVLVGTMLAFHICSPERFAIIVAEGDTFGPATLNKYGL
jgi:MraZ protein